MQDVERRLWRVRDADGTVHTNATFMATHVDSPRRLASLRSALASIALQTVHPNLYLSWSASSAALEDEVRATLEEHAVILRGSYHQAQRRSQFEHNRHTARELAAANERADERTVQWILFSDDDDVWHPQRCEFYCTLISQVDTESRAKSQAMVCPWFLQRTSGHETLPPVASAAEAERELRAGRMAVEDLSGQRDAYEHWSACVRLERVLDFFRMAPDGLVASTFCDVAFARFFGKGHGADVLVNYCKYQSSAGFPWLYAYNVSPDLDVKRLQLTIGRGRTRPRRAIGDDDDDASSEPVASSHASSDLAALTDADMVAAHAALPGIAKQFTHKAQFTIDELAEKLSRDRRTLAVLAASRLWLASTAPAVSPSQRAHAIAEMAITDLMTIWRQHWRKPNLEVAFELYVTDACLCGAMRDILRRLGVEGANAIADAFDEVVASLKDEGCVKTTGFNAVSSVERVRTSRLARNALLDADVATTAGRATPAPTGRLVGQWRVTHRREQHTALTAGKRSARHETLSTTARGCSTATSVRRRQAAWQAVRSE